MLETAERDRKRSVKPGCELAVRQGFRTLPRHVHKLLMGPDFWRSPRPCHDSVNGSVSPQVRTDPLKSTPVGATVRLRSSSRTRGFPAALQGREHLLRRPTAPTRSIALEDFGVEYRVPGLTPRCLPHRSSRGANGAATLPMASSPCSMIHSVVSSTSALSAKESLPSMDRPPSAGGLTWNAPRRTRYAFSPCDIRERSGSCPDLRKFRTIAVRGDGPDLLIGVP